MWTRTLVPKRRLKRDLMTLSSRYYTRMIATSGVAMVCHPRTGGHLALCTLSTVGAKSKIETSSEINVTSGTNPIYPIVTDT